MIHFSLHRARTHARRLSLPFCRSFGRMLLLSLRHCHHCFMVGKFSSSSRLFAQNGCGNQVPLYAIHALPFWLPSADEGERTQRQRHRNETKMKCKKYFPAKRCVCSFVWLIRSSSLFFLSRFYFKLHTRFVKWAHKMIGKDDSGSIGNSNSRHDDIQTTRKPIKIKPERDVEKFREKPCRNVHAKWMCWTQNA